MSNFMIFMKETSSETHFPLRNLPRTAGFFPQAARQQPQVWVVISVVMVLMPKLHRVQRCGVTIADGMEVCSFVV